LPSPAQPPTGGPSRPHAPLPPPATRPGGLAPTTFQARDDQNRAWAASAIRGDAAVRDAFARWDSLSLPQRLQVAERISMLLGNIYGYTPARCSYDASLAGTSTLGYFRSNEGKLYLSDTSLSSPRRLVSTLTHEQAHAYQWEMGVRWNRGQIAVNDPVAPFARAWYANFFNYLDADQSGYSAYASQPTEAHAFATGNAITRLVFS
jgi:hypothetical protein